MKPRKRKVVAIDDSSRQIPGATSDSSGGSNPATTNGSLEPFVVDRTEELRVYDCHRCGYCCTVDLIPIDETLIDRDALYLIECRGGQLVRLEGSTRLFVQYPLRCKYLQSSMACGLWNTPIRPVQCERSPCLHGRVSPAILDWM